MCPLYTVHGARLESSIPLATVGPALAGGRNDGPRPIRFRTAAALPETAATVTLERRGEPEELPLISVGRAGAGYLVRAHGHADFWIDRGGLDVVCVPQPDEPLANVEQLLVDYVLPLTLHAAGQLTLHASSVEIASGEVIAFAGRSGAGKSTLAASLCAGRQLVSDDCLALSLGERGIVVHPSYAAIRLWDDSADAVTADRARELASPRTDKLRVAVPGASGPLALRRIFLLEASEGPPEIVRLRPREALLELTFHLHRLDAEARDHLARELELLASMVERVPVARLRYAHRYEDLAAVHAAIEGELARD